MIKQVEMVFNSHLTAIFQGKPEILRYLMTHERKEKVVKNCCDQIMRAESSNIKHRFNTEKYSTVIFECAKLFSKMALKHAEENQLSRLEKIRRVNENSRLDQIKQEFEADQKEFESKVLKSMPGGVAK